MILRSRGAKVVLSASLFVAFLVATQLSVKLVESKFHWRPLIKATSRPHRAPLRRPRVFPSPFTIDSRLMDQLIKCSVGIRGS